MTAGRTGGARRDVVRRALPFLFPLFWVVWLFATVTPGYALFLLAAVLLHECGHLCAFFLCREPLPRLFGREFGFSLVPRTPFLSFRHEIIICAAGPGFNLLAAACLLPALRGGGATEANFCFFAVQLFTALFNLLPIRGFDGGRVFSALSALCLPPRAAACLAGAVSLACLLLLYFTGAFLFFLAGGSGELLLLSLFLLYGEARRFPRLFEHSGDFGRKRKDS